MEQTEVFRNMTKGIWQGVYDDNGFYFLHCKGMPSPYIAATGGEGQSDESNIAGIAICVNETVGKGVNPQSAEKMKEQLSEDHETMLTIYKALDSKEIHTEELQILLRSKMVRILEALTASKL